MSLDYNFSASACFCLVYTITIYYKLTEDIRILCIKHALREQYFKVPITISQFKPITIPVSF